MEFKFPKPLRVAVYVRLNHYPQPTQKPPLHNPHMGEIDYLMMKLQRKGGRLKNADDH